MMRNKRGASSTKMLYVLIVFGALFIIAMPALDEEMEKAREAVDMARLRSAYEDVSEATLGGNDIVDATKTAEAWVVIQENALDSIVRSRKINPKNGEIDPVAIQTAVKITQTIPGWQSNGGSDVNTISNVDVYFTADDVEKGNNVYTIAYYPTTGQNYGSTNNKFKDKYLN